MSRFFTSRLLAILLFVAPLRAQYVSSAVASAPELMGDGRFKIALTFKGDAGEADVRHEFYATSSADLRTQARTFVAALNAAISDTKALTVGAPIDLTTPPTLIPLPPTPDQQTAAALAVATVQYQQIAALVNLGALDPSIGNAALANLQAAAALQADALSTTVQATTKNITDLGGAVSISPAPVTTTQPAQPGAQQ